MIGSKTALTCAVYGFGIAAAAAAYRYGYPKLVFVAIITMAIYTLFLLPDHMFGGGKNWSEEPPRTKH